jgi:uncharacterized membrane protein
MDETSPRFQGSDSTSDEDKTVAIVSYITIIGFIAAIVMQFSGKKTQLGAFHLRQVLGMVITGAVGSFCWIIPILGWIVGFAVMIGLVIFWFMGIIAAATGQMKPVPVMGRLYQKWFSGAFN